MLSGVEWSKDEDAHLRANYATVCPHVIGRQLGRTRNAVIGRAQRLGLSVPKWVTLSRVADKNRPEPSLRKF